VWVVVFKELGKGCGYAAVMALKEEPILELEKITPSLMRILFRISTIGASENTMLRLLRPFEF
jgi:hypothetical protein